MSEEKKVSALHEILAVEAGLKKTSASVVEEAGTTFEKRAEHFSGHVRTYECKVEGDPTQAEEAIVERQDIVTTVAQKLDYAFSHITAHLDVMATKDATNQTAAADIIIDGAVLVSAVPVTTLLTLEDEIKSWRGMIEKIPTLAPGKSWIAAPEAGENIFKMEHDEIKTRTAKTFKNHVKAEATDKHPAQVEMYTAEIPIGLYKTQRLSGAITPAQKSALLGRVDALHRAVKQARQRANSTPVTERRIGATLAQFLLKA